MKINKEKERSLQRELKEYEKVTPMTEEERIALHVSIPWLQSHSIRYREPSIPNDRAT